MVRDAAIALHLPHPEKDAADKLQIHIPTSSANGALRPGTRKRVQLRHRYQDFADPYRVRQQPRAAH